MAKLSKRLVRRFAPPLAHAYIRLLQATMRLEFRNEDVLERCRQESGGLILAVWHARFVMIGLSYEGRGPMSALVSRHGDARMLGEVFRRLGYDLVFGSSTRGGVAALRDALRRVRKGDSIGLAPDGPKGPRRRAKPGAILLARLTGLPIVPVTFSAAGARRLRSWDRTLVPLPFRRGVFVFGDPLRVPRDADDDAQEQARATLEAELDRITDAADRLTGMPLEAPRPDVAGSPG